MKRSARMLAGSGFLLAAWVYGPSGTEGSQDGGKRKLRGEPRETNAQRRERLEAQRARRPGNRMR